MVVPQPPAKPNYSEVRRDVRDATREALAEKQRKAKDAEERAAALAAKNRETRQKK